MALQVMYPSKPGSPLTSLAEPLAADGTSMTLEDATVLPSAPNIAVIGSDSSAEIVSYTAITGNVVSGLVRALGGTTASAWTTNTAVARNITSYDHDTFKYNIEALNSEKIDGVAWGDVTGTLSNQTDLQTALNAKQGTLSWDTAPTSGGTNPMKSGAIYAHEPFQVTGTASAGSSVTFTDSRINSDHWKVPKNGIYFGTPGNVTSGVHWVTNSTSHTITLQATFSGSTTVEIDMNWYQ